MRNTCLAVASESLRAKKKQNTYRDLIAMPNIHQGGDHNVLDLLCRKQIPRHHDHHHHLHICILLRATAINALQVQRL